MAFVLKAGLVASTRPFEIRSDNSNRTPDPQEVQQHENFSTRGFVLFLGSIFGLQLFLFAPFLSVFPPLPFMLTLDCWLLQTGDEMKQEQTEETNSG